MSSIHTFNLEAIRPQAVCYGGTRAMASEENFPLLKGMSLYLLRLDSGGVREPHWHPNAAELSYCLSGGALMTIFSPGAGHDTFTVDTGEIVFVPRGYLHHIENINQVETKFAIAFNHEMPDNVLGATFNVGADYFGKFKKSNQDLLITSRTDSKVAETTYQKIPNYHKFNLKALPPIVQSKGGTVSLGNANSFELLNGLACYLLTL